MAKKKFKKPKGLKVEYPVACDDCGYKISKPTIKTELGAIRPWPMFKEGKIVIVCSKCKPPRNEVPHVR